MRDNVWKIIEEAYEPKLTKHYEGVFAQGSGYLHIRGSFEEGLACAAQDETYMRMPANVTIEKPRHPRSKCGTYVPGITGNHPLLKEELVNLPNPLCFKVKAEETVLDMDTCSIRDYRRQLYMRDGLLTRSFFWELPGNKKMECAYERYVSMNCPNLIVQKAVFKAVNQETDIELSYDIDIVVKTNGYDHFAKAEKSMEQENCRAEIQTDNGDSVRMITKASADGVPFQYGVYRRHLLPGEFVEVCKMTLVSTSGDRQGFLLPEEMDVQLSAMMEKEREIYKEHMLAWEKLWEDSEVEIIGDEKSQQALNFSIYHLLRCGSGGDSRVAICAKGFAGEAYFGHFFWDTEMYLLPFFLYTQPKMAQRLSKFRIKTLEGAKKNAAAYGYCGAKYPWESGVSGEEQCPNWQYADHEIHVTADVVFGLWHYYQNTKDDSFLAQAAEVFMETTRFWLDRIRVDGEGKAHINGVMGPDEYVCFCDDNVYTNYMAGYSLRVTAQTLLQLKQRNREEYEKFQVEVGFEQRLLKLSLELVIHKREDGILLQCSNFEQLEEPEFERFWTDRSKPFGQFVSQERNYRIKALKQADALMLFYLFGKDMEQEDLEKNYNYYLPYTTHDSSLSKIIHAILCCRREKPGEAFAFFREALDIDLNEEKGGAAEGIHIANCGGIYQAVVFGFAGMSFSYEQEVPTFRPMLPEGWEGIRFKAKYKGKKYKINILQDEVQMTCEEEEEHDEGRQRVFGPVSVK